MMEDWKYFTLQELCASNTARRKKITNEPNSVQIANLDRLVRNTLDPIREMWGSPIIVTSGFRCEELNKLVGGVKNSYHLSGLAADIVASPTLGQSAWVNNFELFRLIEQNKEQWGIDELIAESSANGCEWVHVQIPVVGKSPRHKVIYN